MTCYQHKRCTCGISAHLLDSVGEDDETYEDAYRPVQVPHLGLVLEHFSTDENGEAHDSAHQGVESCKDQTERLSKHSQLMKKGAEGGGVVF